MCRRFGIDSQPAIDFQHARHCERGGEARMMIERGVDLAVQPAAARPDLTVEARLLRCSLEAPRGTDIAHARHRSPARRRGQRACIARVKEEAWKVISE